MTHIRIHPRKAPREALGPTELRADYERPLLVNITPLPVYTYYCECLREVSRSISPWSCSHTTLPMRSFGGSLSGDPPAVPGAALQATPAAAAKRARRDARFVVTAITTVQVRHNSLRSAQLSEAVLHNRLRGQVTGSLDAPVPLSVSRRGCVPNCPLPQWLRCSCRAAPYASPSSGQLCGEYP